MIKRVLLVMLVAFLAMGSSAQAQEEKPNIVFVLADDMRADEVEYMPFVQELSQQGMVFDNSFVTTSQCCPSRSSALRGQYVHNHGVQTNQANNHGGLSQFNQNNNQKSTVATWLDAAGYDTALYGKYLNGCEGCRQPPGWDAWATGDTGTAYVFNHADSYVQNHAGDAPMFLWLAPKSPHGPIGYPDKYKSYYPNAQVPRTPSINEADIADKPAYVRDNGFKDMTEEDNHRRGRARMLAQIDERMRQLKDELVAAGEWDNTIMVFASDNGYLQGEHRFIKKNPPYEESIRVPLIFAGPGIQQGHNDKLALNIDYAETFTELGGGTPDTFVDGRSLVPLLRGQDAPWRDRFGIEFWASRGTDTPQYAGVRTVDEKYVEYVNGDKEYYNLSNDPYELESDPSAAGELPGSAAALRQCAGEACRVADMGGSSSTAAMFTGKDRKHHKNLPPVPAGEVDE